MAGIGGVVWVSSNGEMARSTDPRARPHEGISAMNIRFALAGAFALAAVSVGAARAAPTDPQIAHTAYTAGTIDIAAARQALAKSKNPKVIAFAKEMVEDHAAVNDQALALCKKLGVTPEPNPTSMALQTAAEAKRADLAKLSGPAFDKAYAVNEVAYHKAVNGALADTLIPDAKNPDLKSLLQTGLKLFQEHQRHAEQLAGQL
jgi:putative membrane protein